MKMVIENFIILLLMISCIIKCNFFSLVYLLFVIRYPTVYQKTDYLIHLNIYMAFILFVNYLFLILNLTPKISPVAFPAPFNKYPDNWMKDETPIYFIPLFFH